MSLSLAPNGQIQRGDTCRAKQELTFNSERMTAAKNVTMRIPSGEEVTVEHVHTNRGNVRANVWYRGVQYNNIPVRWLEKVLASQS